MCEPPHPCVGHCGILCVLQLREAWGPCLRTCLVCGWWRSVLFWRMVLYGCEAEGWGFMVLDCLTDIEFRQQAERETNLSPCSFMDVIDWAVTLRNSRSHCMSAKISHWRCIKERRQIVPLGLVWPGASPDFNLSLPCPVFSVCSLLLLDCLSYVCWMYLFYVSVCMLVPNKGLCSFFIEQHRKCDMGKKWGTLYTSYETESYRGRGHFTDPNWPRLAPQTANRISSYNTCCLQNLWDICFKIAFNMLAAFSKCDYPNIPPHTQTVLG